MTLSIFLTLICNKISIYLYLPPPNPSILTNHFVSSIIFHQRNTIIYIQSLYIKLFMKNQPFHYSLKLKSTPIINQQEYHSNHHNLHNSPPLNKKQYLSSSIKYHPSTETQEIFTDNNLKHIHIQPIKEISEADRIRKHLYHRNKKTQLSDQHRDEEKSPQFFHLFVQETINKTITRKNQDKSLMEKILLKNMKFKANMTKKRQKLTQREYIKEKAEKYRIEKEQKNQYLSYSKLINIKLLKKLSSKMVNLSKAQVVNEETHTFEQQNRKNNKTIANMTQFSYQVGKKHELNSLRTRHIKTQKAEEKKSYNNKGSIYHLSRQPINAWQHSDIFTSNKGIVEYTKERVGKTDRQSRPKRSKNRHRDSDSLR